VEIHRDTQDSVRAGRRDFGKTIITELERSFDLASGSGTLLEILAAARVKKGFDRHVEDTSVRTRKDSPRRGSERSPA